MPGRRGRAGLAPTVLLSDAVHAVQCSSESLGLQAPSETGRFLLFLDIYNSLLCLKDFREGPAGEHRLCLRAMRTTWYPMWGLGVRGLWGFQIKSVMEIILGDAPILKVPFCHIRT